MIIHFPGRILPDTDYIFHSDANPRWEAPHATITGSAILDVVSNDKQNNGFPGLTQVNNDILQRLQLLCRIV